MVTYARPFSSTNGIGALKTKRFGRFDEHRMKATHDLLLQVRDETHAYTDDDPIMQTVWVFPPGSIGDRPGFAAVGRFDIAREVLVNAAELCDIQTTRARERIRELVVDLYVDGSTKPFALRMDDDA